ASGPSPSGAAGAASAGRAPPPSDPQTIDPTSSGRAPLSAVRLQEAGPQAPRLHEPAPLGPRSSDPSLKAVRIAATQAQIRPFPPRFAGRFQVRGPVLRSIDKALLELYGKSARQQVMQNLPGRYAGDFVTDSFNVLVAYELEALDAYMELATLLVLKDVIGWRE